MMLELYNRYQTQQKNAKLEWYAGKVEAVKVIILEIIVKNIKRHTKKEKYICSLILRMITH